MSLFHLYAAYSIVPTQTLRPVHVAMVMVLSFLMFPIARRFRHSAIFGALAALQAGEAMRFVNDHDPLPLLAQLQERFGDRLEIAYRQREPGAIVIDFIIVA